MQIQLYINRLAAHSGKLPERLNYSHSIVPGGFDVTS